MNTINKSLHDCNRFPSPAFFRVQAQNAKGKMVFLPASVCVQAFPDWFSVGTRRGTTAPTMDFIGGPTPCHGGKGDESLGFPLNTLFENVKSQGQGFAQIIFFLIHDLFTGFP